MTRGPMSGGWKRSAHETTVPPQRPRAKRGSPTCRLVVVRLRGARHRDPQLATLDRRVLLGAVLAGVLHARGERLARDVRLVRAGRVEQLRVAAERQRDAVLDGQAGRLARVLHGVDDLAREALAPQLVVERE